jgi:hypothetical protein
MAATARRRRSPEHDQQAAFFRWVWLRFPKWHQLIFAVPNGGHMNAITAARLRAEGVTSGVWDVCVLLPGMGYHGAFIEFKAGANKLTPEQVAFREAAVGMGYKCIGPVYTWHEAARGLLGYLGIKQEV